MQTDSNKSTAPFTGDPAGSHFGAWRVLVRSFRICFRNIVPFYSVAFIVYIPLFIYTLVTIADGLTRESENEWAQVVSFLPPLLTPLVTGAVIYGTFLQLAGQRFTFGKSVSIGIKYLFPVLFTSMAVGFSCVFALMLLLGLGFPPALALLAAGFGVFLYCTLFAAVPAVVVERLGIRDSFFRSQALTQGCRGAILAVLILLAVFSLLMSSSIRALIVVDPTDTASQQIYMFAVLFLSAFMSTLSAVVQAVVYHDLRADKESVDLEALARSIE